MINTPNALLDRLCPGMPSTEQRRTFSSLVGFRADVVMYVWHKYAQFLRINRVKLLDLVWTCSWLKMNQLWRVGEHRDRRDCNEGDNVHDNTQI